MSLLTSLINFSRDNSYITFVRKKSILQFYHEEEPRGCEISLKIVYKKHGKTIA